MKDTIVDGEILHGDKSENVEWCLEPRNKFFEFAMACLLISISFHCLHLCCFICTF